MGDRSEISRVVRETWREVHDENVTFMAGSIAYYAFISILPLVVFALVVLSVIDNAAFTARLYELTESFLTPYARQLLVESFDVTAARTSVSVIGAATLLWGTSRIFRGLDVAFSEIYSSHRNKSLLETFENAIVVFLALVAAVGVFVLAGSVAAVSPDLPYPSVVNPILLVVGLAVAFVPIYYVFPDVDLTLLEILPGVVFAAIGWAALEAAFQGYVTYATRYETIYGTLGSAFLLLIWLYCSGLVLLVGGVLNAVLAGRTDDEHALNVTDEVSAEPEGDDGRRTPDDDGDASDGERTGPDDGTGSHASSGGHAGSDDPDPGNRGSGDRGPGDRDELGRAYEELGRAYEELDADRQRLREEVARLEAENERLRRENDHLTRQLARRRSVWAWAKRLVGGGRG